MTSPVRGRTSATVPKVAAADGDATQRVKSFFIASHLLSREPGATTFEQWPDIASASPEG
jgi:hypothetical protein